MPAPRQAPRSEAAAPVVSRMYDLLLRDRDPVAEPGTPGDWWTVFALAPEILKHAVMARALRLEFDDRPDPVVEVAAPESFDAGDFLGAARRAPPPSTPI